MTDIEIVRTVAEYRVLTVSQATVLMFSSDQVARRRLRKLKDKDLLASAPRSLRGVKGRPENVIFVSPEGRKLLVSHGVLPRDLSYDYVGAGKLQCVDHELLVNWFRIHLLEMEKQYPEYSVEFISSASPFFLRGDGYSLLRHQIDKCGNERSTTYFIPDGAFCITRNVDMKSLLFFLEVDMSTETLLGTKTVNRDIGQKIKNYRAYLGRQLYSSYDRTFRKTFKGFRVLFVASTQPRMDALSRAAQAMQPSSFVWVSSQGQISKHGLASKIWAREGNVGRRPESIFGNALRSTSVRPSFPQESTRKLER